MLADRTKHSGAIAAGARSEASQVACRPQLTAAMHRYAASRLALLIF